MVIIDEKQMLPPPPPYVPPPPGVHNGLGRNTLHTPPASAAHGLALSPPPFPGQCVRVPATLAILPPHILLYIVHQTLPQNASKIGMEGKVERQRKVLYWMTISLRLVNRVLYVACMHVLRSTYLPAYTALIRPPYSSDPFPLTAPTPAPYSSSSSCHLTTPVNSVQRETAVLDLFLSVKVREDVWADDSELHLEREEAPKDLFDLMQPRARVEDLVRVYGTQAGVISVSGQRSSFSSSPSPSPQATSFSSSSGASSSFGGLSTSSSLSPSSSRRTPTVPFSALSVSFSTRRVGLVLTTRSGRRTVVEVARTRDEPLEVAAKRLVKELKRWLADER